MSKKWSISKQLKVYSKTNFKCAYCGKDLDFEPHKLSCGVHTYNFAIDHLIPKSKGGTNETQNLLPCCKSCNSKKGTKSLEEFRFIETLRENDIPLFTTEQIEFLKQKIDISKIFPRLKKFYFELCSDYHQKSFTTLYREEDNVR